MKDLFDQIEKVIPTIEGWGEIQKCQTLAAMVIALRPEISVEIGVYGGRTFFGMALAHKFLGRGRVIGIDPWTNEAATEGYSGSNLNAWKAAPLEDIYSRFVYHVNVLGLKNVSQIERCKSDDFQPPQGIGLLHVDGQHTGQAVRDVERYASNIDLGGLVVMDDTEWVNEGDAPVKRAVKSLRSLGFHPLYKLGTGEVFQRGFK